MACVLSLPFLFGLFLLILPSAHCGAVHDAARGGNLERLKLIAIQKLYANGKDVTVGDKITNLQLTPLHLASYYGHLDIAERLLDWGVPMNKATKPFGLPPMFYAAAHGNDEVLKFLIEAGADIDYQGDYGKTPLWGAAHEGKLSSVKLLIKKGADINLKGKMSFEDDSMYQTALAAAKGNDHIEVVKVLRKVGAKP